MSVDKQRRFAKNRHENRLLKQAESYQDGNNRRYTKASCEGQKRFQSYKDNWNDILEKKNDSTTARLFSRGVLWQPS